MLNVWSQIRCSGYQNSPGGKCTNCVKMQQECVFQPVSSASSTAFVPVSALQNGIPPGTQLFGAYGQPLSGHSNASPTDNRSSGGYSAVSPSYDQPLPSPTGSYNSFDDRAEVGRRRQRPAEDNPGMRLPPPNSFSEGRMEDAARRRSPSSSSPGHLSTYQQQPPSNSHHGYESRTPPPRGSPSGPPQGGSSANSVMSLGNIMDTGPSTSNDIDRSMLGRLNRRS